MKYDQLFLLQETKQESNDRVHKSEFSENFHNMQNNQRNIIKKQKNILNKLRNVLKINAAFV